MKTPVTHRSIFRHLCENLDQDLNSPKCRAIKQHLRQCPECAVYLKGLKETRRLYCRYPVPKLSGKAKKELQTILRLQN